MTHVRSSCLSTIRAPGVRNVSTASVFLLIALPLFVGCDCSSTDQGVKRVDDPDTDIAGVDEFRMNEQEIADAITAAEDGDGRAAFLLFEHYTIPNDDPTLARHWLRRSAVLGYTPGQVNLGVELIRDSLDSGMKAEAEEGVRWLRTAADAGDPDAARFLGYYEQDPELLR